MNKIAQIENEKIQLNIFTQLICKTRNNFILKKLRVIFSGFLITIEILETNMLSPLSFTSSACEGTFGKLYFLPLLHEEIAIKSTPFVKDVN